MNNIENPRWLFFAHTNVMVISEKVARKGLDQVVDLYLRNPDARETVNVVITSGSARAVLEQLMHSEKIPGQGIREIIQNESRNSSYLPNVMMYELAIALTGSAKSALLPEIIVSGEPSETSLDALKNTTAASKLKLGRLAVLNGDKLAGWLTREEGLGVAFITDKVNTSTLAFRCSSSGGNNYNSSFRLLKSATKLTPLKNKDRFTVKLDVKVSGTLMESSCSLDYNQPKVIEQLEQQLEKEITNIIKTSLKAVKRLRVDVLGFADAVHRKYPKEWKNLESNWESSFGKIEVDPQVTVSIDRVGLTGKSFQTK